MKNRKREISTSGSAKGEGGNILTYSAGRLPTGIVKTPQADSHEAVDRVARAIVQEKTRIIDIDLRSYFDNVRDDRLLAKVAQRVDDADVLHVLKLMLKAVDVASRRAG